VDDAGHSAREPGITALLVEVSCADEYTDPHRRLLISLPPCETTSQPTGIDRVTE
jgi:hypothetical protein